MTENLSLYSCYFELHIELITMARKDDETIDSTLLYPRIIELLKDLKSSLTRIQKHFQSQKKKNLLLKDDYAVHLLDKLVSAKSYHELIKPKLPYEVRYSADKLGAKINSILTSCINTINSLCDECIIIYHENYFVNIIDRIECIYNDHSIRFDDYVIDKILENIMDDNDKINFLIKRRTEYEYLHDRNSCMYPDTYKNQMKFFDGRINAINLAKSNIINRHDPLQWAKSHEDLLQLIWLLYDNKSITINEKPAELKALLQFFIPLFNVNLSINNATTKLSRFKANMSFATDETFIDKLCKRWHDEKDKPPK